MTIDKEQRAFHRIFYSAKAELTSGQQLLQCEIVDISLKGCLLRFNETWAEDLEQLHALNLKLSDEASINMELSVAHVIDNLVGFKCEHIDIESITQLRRLVELNLGDSQILERDLIALSSIHSSESTA